MHVCRCERSSIPGQRDGCRYDLVGMAFNVGSQQDVVVYQGVDDMDGGKMFVTTQVAWADRFERVD
jgi:hypothetical protein